MKNVDENRIEASILYEKFKTSMDHAKKPSVKLSTKRLATAMKIFYDANYLLKKDLGKGRRVFLQRNGSETDGMALSFKDNIKLSVYYLKNAYNIKISQRR